MITLYQFDSCPFCWKVKALLNYSGHHYETVEVSPFGMKELDFTDHKKVPVLKDGDEIIVESANIVRHVNDKYSQLPVSDHSGHWSQWIDDILVHYLPPLIHPNFGTSLKNFAGILENNRMGWFKKKLTGFTGALVMPRVARKLQTRHGISNPHQEFTRAIDKWIQDGLAGQAFFGGNEADFIDCSVFGVLHSSHKLGVIDMAATHNPEFTQWYQRCLPLMSNKPIQDEHA